MGERLYVTLSAENIIDTSAYTEAFDSFSYLHVFPTFFCNGYVKLFY